LKEALQDNFWGNCCQDMRGCTQRWLNPGYQIQMRSVCLNQETQESSALRPTMKSRYLPN